jgi:hypothetical protein
VAFWGGGTQEDRRTRHTRTQSTDGVAVRGVFGGIHGSRGGWHCCSVMVVGGGGGGQEDPAHKNTELDGVMGSGGLRTRGVWVGVGLGVLKLNALGGKLGWVGVAEGRSAVV